LIVVQSPERKVDYRLELNCWVLGDDLGHIFTVEISSTKNVATLKKDIKNEKKHKFQHVDADTLVLWKVSIPRSDLEQNINIVDKKLLLPMDRLWQVFSDILEEDHLHIVVEPPPIGEFLWLVPV
jgi:Crinkler effector protein N-terminal domain